MYDTARRVALVKQRVRENCGKTPAGGSGAAYMD